MENEVVKNNNTMIKTIVFVLVAGLTCLLFFGLGETEKTKPSHRLTQLAQQDLQPQLFYPYRHLYIYEPSYFPL